MKVGALVLLIVAALATMVAAIAPDAAKANQASCGSGVHGRTGYAYAGHQANVIAHGIRATITPLVQPAVAAGHVAGWIGVGGPGAGPSGETMWLQAGVASMPGTPMVVYAEITRPAKEPVFVPLVQDVEVGEPHRLAVLELSQRPGVWRVWLDGRPATAPIVLPGSRDRWRPIATAESWNGGASRCTRLGFRFEGVGVATSTGGSWRTFVPGFMFKDRGYAVRQLRPSTGGQRTLASDPIAPFAFVASSL